MALANGGVQLNALNQNIALNTTGGTANLVIEPNTGGSSNGEVICFYGFQNLSDEKRPAALGDGGAGALRRRGGQELRSSRRRRQANGRGAGGLQVRPAGQELLQAQELRGPGAHDAGLPADDGGALADLKEPAAEARKAGEEEARAVGLARSNGRRGGESARRSGRQLA